MPGASSLALTKLLRAWGSGDESALERLMPLVYDELRRVARRYMARQRPNHTLQTTALVNEVYVRLVNVSEATWQDRAHFFAVCAKLMRRILIDYERYRHNKKRGGRAVHIPLDDALEVSPQAPGELLALDYALNALAAIDIRKANVVELRFFGGLSVKEAAEVLKVSEETVHRDWRLAKLWLLRELSGEKADAS